MTTDNFSAAELANRPSLEDFHSAFDIVFIDTTGYLNLCADMSAAHYQLVFILFYYHKLIFVFVVLCVMHILSQTVVVDFSLYLFECIPDILVSQVSCHAIFTLIFVYLYFKCHLLARKLLNHIC